MQYKTDAPKFVLFLSAALWQQDFTLCSVKFLFLLVGDIFVNESGPETGSLIRQLRGVDYANETYSWAGGIHQVKMSDLQQMWAVKRIWWIWPLSESEVLFNIVKSLNDRRHPLLIPSSGSLCEAGVAGSVAADWDVEGRQQNPHPVQSQYSALVCISIRVLNKWVWLVISVLLSETALSSSIQVKETDAVVLAGAYVDLHGAAEASPENLTQVRQPENAPFEQRSAFFSFYQIHGGPGSFPFSSAGKWDKMNLKNLWLENIVPTICFFHLCAGRRPSERAGVRRDRPSY